LNGSSYGTKEYEIVDVPTSNVAISSGRGKEREVLAAHDFVIGVDSFVCTGQAAELGVATGENVLSFWKRLPAVVTLVREVGCNESPMLFHDGVIHCDVPRCKQTKDGVIRIFGR